MSVEFQFGQELNPESVALQSYKVKVNSEIGVDAYDNTQTYAVGDYCINANTIYKCTTAISTPEAWNASHWQSTSIMKEFSDVNASLVKLTQLDVIGNYYSNYTDTYTTTNLTLKTETITLTHKSKILFSVYGCIKTASNTGSLLLRVDNEAVASAASSITSFNFVEAARPYTLDAGTYSVTLVLLAQNNARCDLKSYSTYGWNGVVIPID